MKHSDNSFWTYVIIEALLARVEVVCGGEGVVELLAARVHAHPQPLVQLDTAQLHRRPVLNPHNLRAHTNGANKVTRTHRSSHVALEFDGYIRRTTFIQVQVQESLHALTRSIWTNTPS